MDTKNRIKTYFNHVFLQNFVIYFVEQQDNKNNKKFSG